MKGHIIIFLLVQVFFISCNKQLDYTNDGRILLSSVFQDRYETMGYLNSCYGYCPAPGLSRSAYCDEAEDVSDITAGSAISVWYTGGITASNYVSYSADGSPWTNLYIGINKCNVFLANIGTSTADMSDNERKGWAAEARTLRALYYLQLIKRYGGVPIVNQPLPVNYDFSKDKRASFSAVVKFILSDCDSALTAPDAQDGFSWNIYTNQNGIMTRAIPYAIKSEAVTYAASPLWSDGTYSWADATAINKDALSQCLTHDYSLFNQAPVNNAAQNAYALYFITNPNDQRSVDKETILQIGGQQNIWQNAGLPSVTNVNSAGPGPSQELVDAYDMANGKPAITGYSDGAHLNPIINTASGYDPANPYANRDPRFYASIYYNGALVGLNQVNSSAGMKFTANSPFYAINATCPSWSDNIGNLTFALYKWNTDYATSIAGTPLTSMFYPNFTDGQNLSLFFTTPLPAGTYVWVLNNGSQKVGVWEYPTTTPAGCVSYFNGTPVSGTANYQSQISYAPAPYSYNYLAPTTAGTTRTAIQIPAYNVVNSYVGGADGISQTDLLHTRTGYYVRKFNNWQSALNNNADGYIRLLRLAELYLNFAESAYQSDGPYAEIALGSGMTMSAADAVNAIRTRAGMPNLPAGLDNNTFQTRYRNERRIELAFEGQRFFDVRRWKILGQTDQNVTGINITRNNNVFSYSRFGFNARNDVADKWLIYPLDVTEVTKMQTLTGTNWQNTGW